MYILYERLREYHKHIVYNFKQRIVSAWLKRSNFMNFIYVPFLDLIWRS